MNKEVIYLEPEDDITDILTKLQRAEQKLVALVPPKKAAMFRSAVNMKLVARAAKESKKVAVIVTSDPAVVKLAMAAQIPVAKTLQSRPVVPTPEMIKDAEPEEQIIDEESLEKSAKDAENSKNRKNSSKTPAEASNSAAKTPDGKKADILDIDENSLENGSKDPKKANSKAKKDKDGKKSLLSGKNRKFVIIGAVAALVLIIFGVWALVFAPAAEITVAMHTSSSNFSEPVSFTTEKSDENIEEGKFYVEKQTYEDKFDTDFSATGQEDRGDKAKGSLKLSYSISPSVIKEKLHEGLSVSVPAGTVFTASNGLDYVSTEDASLSWDGETGSGHSCGSSSSSCTLTETVHVEAANSGASYDVGTSASWKTSISGLSVSSSSGISGGSSKMVTIVTQADVNKAAEARDADDEAKGKEQLLSEIPDDKLAIESSYAMEVGDLSATPGVGSEVSDGKAHLSAVTTYSIYVIDKSAVEEFVKHKTELSDDQKIYSIGEPYFERFTSIDEVARLKTTIKVGPTVTEENILERAKGRKIGEVQSILRSINGVSSVEVNPSYFWVRTIPNDDAKVKVNLTVEDES